MPRSMRAMQRRARGDRLMMDDMRRYNRGEYEYDLAEMTKQNQEIRHDPYMPRDYETGEVYAGLNDFYGEEDMARNRREMDMARRRGDYAGQSGYSRANYGSRANYQSRGDYNYEDGHYPMVQGYMPIEAMGRFTGYYGMGEDNARGGRGRDYGDYNYDMRGRGRDYNYDYGYGRDYAGDYGESLTKEELEQWRKKLDREVGDEQSKHFFKKENIEQKARQMGVEMKNFNAEELALAAYMLYSDYCKSLKPYVGQNMDVFIKMGEEFLTDPNSAVKGGEKLALYYEIVAGEDD